MLTPVYEEPLIQLFQGHVLDVLAQMAPASVHAICTSPPYFGLRNYQLEPEVWGGVSGCQHLWGDVVAQDSRHRWTAENSGVKHTAASEYPKDRGAWCQICTAWRGSLGLESLPFCPDAMLGQDCADQCYLGHLLQVCDGLWRVLRDDGTLWIVLGDSYAQAKGHGHWESRNGKGDEHEQKATQQWSQRGAEDIGLKPKDLMMMPARVAIALQARGWTLRSEIPWLKQCLSGGTRVYARTQKGDMPMTIKDLVRLRPETVQLWNGQQWTRVIGYHQVCPDSTRKHMARKHAATIRAGQIPLFSPQYLEIELRTGERIGCTAEHRWPTTRGLLTTEELRLGDILERTPIPEPTLLSMPPMLDDELIGWFVGLYLAEGCMDDRVIHLSGHVLETESRLKKLQSIAAAYDGTAGAGRAHGNKQDIYMSGRILRGILETYLTGDNALNKGLTTKVWQRSNVFLMSILQGYLEGDGHYDEGNDRWRLGFGNNDGLASDLRTIGARLNISVRIKRGRATAIKGGEFHKTWRGSIRLRHINKSSGTQFYKKLDTEIIAIRQSRARIYWDIEVADEPHLFALASGVLTHNSAMPESVRDRPSVSHETVFLFSKGPHYYYDPDAVRGACSPNSHGGPNIVPGRKNTVLGQGDGNLGKWTAEQKVSGRNRRTGDWWYESLDQLISDTESWLAHAKQVRAYGGLLLSPDGEPLGLNVNPQAYSGAHFAVFPENLIRPMILASTSEYGACSATVKKLRLRQDLTPEEAAKVERFLKQKGLV